MEGVEHFLVFGDVSFEGHHFGFIYMFLIELGHPFF